MDRGYTRYLRVDDKYGPGMLFGVDPTASAQSAGDCSLPRRSFPAAARGPHPCKAFSRYPVRQGDAENAIPSRYGSRVLSNHRAPAHGCASEPPARHGERKGNTPYSLRRVIRSPHITA